MMKDWLSGGAPVSFDRFESAMVYPRQAFNWLAIYTRHSHAAENVESP